jgi:hypothetical protein
MTNDESIAKIEVRNGEVEKRSDGDLRLPVSPFHSSFVIRVLLLLTLLLATAARAQPLVHAKDGSGIYGYKDTPKLPWCNYLVHDPDRPVPKRVDPGPVPPPALAPSDAIILFGGRNLNAWQSNDWKLVDGCIEAVGNSALTTKDNFGSFQLHIEWLLPANFEGHPFDRGNNGVFLMGLYEIQIFDSWNEKIYPDGQAAAIYGQTPPLVNACRKPGEWQSFGIFFTAPVFANGKLQQPARVTVLHNGVLVQHNEVIHGETGHRVLPEHKRALSQGPLVLGGHKCPVRFRNIWLRPL